MRETLVGHAIKNVWCAPRQDRQFILELAKVTPFLGSRKTVKVIWDTIELPEPESYYHVYQIGQNYPDNFGLEGLSDKWTNLATLCSQTLLLVDLYTDSGLHFPLTDSWVRVTRDANLIVAVRLQPSIADLDKNALYMRFYSNAYFESVQSQSGVDKIAVVGGRIRDMDHYSQLQNAYYQHRALKPGHCYAFFNGYLVNDLLPDQWKRGDVFEFVYDSSIYRIVEWDINKLVTYDSLIDKKRKYLLHPSKRAGQQIDYRDDIDFWLYRAQAPFTMKGVLVHKNQEDTVRMVTHCDYGLAIAPVEKLVTDHPHMGTALQTKVRAHIRRSGYNRPLVFERNRIHELYKLSDAKIIAAMYGRHATVPEWQVANLEASAYTALMRAEYEDVTFDRVVNAYGYNALSVVTAQTPQRPESQQGVRGVTLPPGLQDSCTVFEYDTNGLLLEINRHSAGKQYVLGNQSSTQLVEAFSGEGGDGFETWFGGNPVPVDPNYLYRVYRTAKGYPNGKREWEDVTTTGDHNIVNGKIVFQNTNIYDYLVVSDRKFLVYGLKLNYRDHLLKFTVNSRNAAGIVEPIEFKPGRITLWLNRHRLIENVDYFVKWPQIVICNKRYLDQSKTDQSIVISCSGFADAKGERYPQGDCGFVKFGVLSVNNKFDIRDDKVISCVVDGRTFHRDQLLFKETSKLVRVEGVREGAPYQINEVYVAIRGVEDYNTQIMREEAVATDKRVEDYMSYWLPQEPVPEPQIIPELHWVYSPFFAKVLWDLKNGVLEVDSLYRPDKQILEELEPYRYLLGYDPALREEIDWRYIDVHPHHSTNVVFVRQAQWAYLKRVNQLFLKDRVKMSSFLAIDEEV